MTHGDTCLDLVESVTAYLDGAMTRAEVTVFEAHLRACPPCEVYVEQIRITIRETGRLPGDTLPTEVCDDLVAAFRDWRAGGLRA